MTGKERVLNTIKRKPSDRMPASLRCTPEALEALLARTGTGSKQELYDSLGIDFRWIGLPFIGPKNRSLSPLGGEGYDFWGCYNKAVKNDFNTYYEITYHPLGEMSTVKEIEDYDWPDLDWWDYSAVPDIIRQEKQSDDTAIMFFAGGAFESPWYMRGLEQFLIDIYDQPEIAEAISRKVADFYYERALRVIEASNGMIDVIGSGGDIGGQHTMMLSPEKWRKHIKPYSAKLITPFKDMGFGTFYHSDGAIVPVINDFIDMGLDILDPIQVGAAGMTPEELYPKFGDRLSFHGAIDEVELLPHATSDEVYKETKRIMGILGASNGYIVSPTHQVQGDTDPDNVLAIYKAVRDNEKV
ncbi:MAG TPA: uroporphyrinogen decarboxylase family protein [Clostridia bacterium]|nr:uroporphyrinogen decarboxylase family protein [Clostridia bacterium]